MSNSYLRLHASIARQHECSIMGNRQRFFGIGESFGGKPWVVGKLAARQLRSNNMTNDQLKSEIEQLKKDIFSDDWELGITSADRLGEIGGDEVVEFLISLIALDDSSIRNRAALALAYLQDNRALEPLLAAIFKKENHNYNGTMVYALNSLDCSQKLKEIFKILFFESYESKASVYAILSDQIFEFTVEDLLEIQRMWDDCKKNPEKCPYYDNIETREMIQDTVEGFMSYLSP